jgi:hypothetical protein
MLPLIRKQDASSVVLVMFSLCLGDSRGRDRMVVGFTTTYAICISPLTLCVEIPHRRSARNTPLPTLTIFYVYNKASAAYKRSSTIFFSKIV